MRDWAVDPGRTTGAWPRGPGEDRRVESSNIAELSVIEHYSTQKKVAFQSKKQAAVGAARGTANINTLPTGRVVLFFLYMMASNEVNFTWSSAPTAAHARSHSGTI